MNKIDMLKINNNLNLDLNFTNNLEKQTNDLVSKIMTDFCQQYNNFLTSKFILLYDGTVESALTFNIIKGLHGITDFAFYIYYPKNISKIKKEYFKNIKTINYHKLKHSKNKVLISPYNPITNKNVKESIFLSNFFTERYYPLQNFTPQELIVLFNWYIDPKSIFYDKNFEQTYRKAYNIFFDTSKEIPPIFSEYLNDNSYVYNIYQLTNNDQNNGLMDLILENNKDPKAINIYTIEQKDEQSISFIKYYNYYMDFKHRINDYSLFVSDDDEEIIKHLYQTENTKYYSYKDYIY